MNPKIRELREKHICKLLIAGGFYFAGFGRAGLKSEFSRTQIGNAPSRAHLSNAALTYRIHYSGFQVKRKLRLTVPFRRLARITVAQNLPANPSQSDDGIEMTVAAQDGKMMLPAKGGDPEMVARNWRARLPELDADGCIVGRGLIANVQHLAVMNKTLQPLPMLRTVAGPLYPKVVFPHLPQPEAPTGEHLTKSRSRRDPLLPQPAER